MLPGKGPDTKLNLLLEESATEKISRSKIFIWFLSNIRLAASILAGLLVLFLISALWFTKTDVRFQEQYIKIQSNVQMMEDQLFLGNNEGALEIWTETSPLINGFQSFIQAFQAKSAELLLLLNAQKSAIPLMQSTLDRTEATLNPALIPFINITKKAAANDMRSALLQSESLISESESSLPIMLQAYTILQIPIFSKALNDHEKELEWTGKILTLVESRSELGAAVYLLTQTIRSETTTYLDYLKERKDVLTSQ